MLDTDVGIMQTFRSVSTSIMILRHHHPRSSASICQLFAPSSTQCIRPLHSRAQAPPIPSPTPFVPDVPTFLKVIGRNASQHAAKFPNWEALFSFSSHQLRESGLEPARTRRYLLRWRDKFRKGEFGVGGDLTEVVDGVGEVRVVEVPLPVRPGSSSDRIRTKAKGTLTLSPGMRKMIVNVKPGSKEPPLPLDQARPVDQLKIRSGHVISGPYVRLVKGFGGSVARIAVEEGMWEHRRGHKVDGGERRKAEVRAKRRAKERA